MTEDEAKTKDCCGPSACGQVVKGALRRTCIASACMAWRLDEGWQYECTPNSDPPPGEGWEPGGVGFGAGETAWKRLVRHGGYCGLAGAQP